MKKIVAILLLSLSAMAYIGPFPPGGPSSGSSSGGGGSNGTTTVGSFAGSSQPNGATISGTTITFGPADGTNPGMVSTTAQTFAGVKTFSSAPILTGFTNGSVLFATSSGIVSQDNAKFFWDDNNFRLGIGTATPTGPLDAVRNGIGQVSSDGIVVENNTVAAPGAQQYSPRIRLTGQGWKTNATAASRTVDWTIQTVPLQSNANPTSYLDFSSQINGGGYTNRLALVSSGNVGIGTVTPGSKLSVAGTIESTTSGFKFPDATIQTTAANQWQTNGSGIFTSFSAVGMNGQTVPTEGLDVHTNAKIGTVNPTTLGIVNGTVNPGDAIINYTGNVGQYAGPAGTIRIGSEVITYTGNNGSSFTGCTRGSYGTTAGTYSAGQTIYYYMLQVQQSVGGTMEAFTVDSNNRVGIGTPNPTANLDIFGTGSATDLFLGFATMVRSAVTSEGPWQYIWSNAAAGATHDAGLYLADSSADFGTLIFAIGDGAGSYVNSLALHGTDGKVGVLTLTPQSALDVNGSTSTNHIIGNTSAPAIAAGAGAGTGPTVSVVGTDLALKVNVTTGTLPTGANATIATITFNVVYGAAPHCIFVPDNAVSALLTGASAIFINETTTTFLLKSGTTALTAATGYSWEILCAQ